MKSDGMYIFSDYVLTNTKYQWCPIKTKVKKKRNLFLESEELVDGVFDASRICSDSADISAFATMRNSAL